MKQITIKQTAKIQSLNLHGLKCQPVEIEVDIANGLPALIIVGLPDTAVYEARDRVRSAIKNSGYEFPRTRVTVNLAPAHMRKAGSLFDLPIALGILVAAKVIKDPPLQLAIGELALDGRLRAVKGALPVVHTAVQELKRDIFIPHDNLPEAQLADCKKIFPAKNLRQVVECLQGKQRVDNATGSKIQAQPTSADQNQPEHSFDNIIGQQLAKRALEVAAAGAHNLFMTGPPGTGKSMLASALPSILPQMTDQEIMQATMIHSVAGQECSRIINQRPFYAPHHTASSAAIIGGGQQLHPGVISLAHTGVLFFDELPEFRRDVLEALRQPLEKGTVTIARMHGRVTYPAQCQFIAAQNPCPCGFADNINPTQAAKCTCTAYRIQQYTNKISGPLLDRIDIKVYVPAVPVEELTVSRANRSGPQTEHIKEQVQHARDIQIQRQQKTNAQLSIQELEPQIKNNINVQQLLKKAMREHHLSMRGYLKTLRLARSIADLAQEDKIQEQHVAEAITYVR